MLARPISAAHVPANFANGPTIAGSIGLAGLSVISSVKDLKRP